MKKKNKKIAIASATFILTVTCLGSLLNSASNKDLSFKDEYPLKNDQLVAMYIEGSDGYELSTDQTFPTKGYVLNTEKSTCRNGGTISQDPETKNLSVSVAHADQCSAYFDFDGILGRVIATSHGVKTSFDSPATTDEGIFEMEDDYGTSYYYRGAVENNYVKFGQNKSGQDMYWRIIRVNGDGSLRIMYTGTQAYANGTNNSEMFIGTSVWNSVAGDAKYVGWMYGGTKGTASTSKEQAQTNETNSDIKTVVDTWYKENIVDTGYSDAVADILFCNDRTTPGSSVSEWTRDTGLGYGENITQYGAGARFMTGNNGTILDTRKNVKPIFICPEKNDSFTVSDTTKGNGDLTYPVGLITADEIVAAGNGKYRTINSQYYLYRPSNWYWSLSPSYYYTDAGVFYVYTAGNLNNFEVNTLSGGVAPVINLSAEYSSTLKGTGTTSDPYRAV